jgi:hypothetical protein
MMTERAQEAARATIQSPNRRAWAEICRFLAGSPKETFLAERQAAWAYRKKLQRERRLQRGLSTMSTAGAHDGR